jgi:hypothetical protein
VSPPAILLPEVELLRISNAAQWLCPSDRDAFWGFVAEELYGCEIGDGSVGRAVMKAFRQFYKPLQLSEAPRPRAHFKRVV